MTSLTNAAPWVDPCSLEPLGPVRTIRLVPLQPRHAADLHSVADRDLFQHTMQGPAEWSARGFELELAKVAALPGTVAFAIVLVRDHEGLPAGHAIGRTTFMDIKPEHRGLEIGRTWIARRFHGTRVNPEAKYLMLRHAFEGLSPSAIRVQLTTSSSNLHSQRAISRLGAIREGELRKARILPPQLDRSESLVRGWVHFSIVDDEWPAVKARLEDRLS